MKRILYTLLAAFAFFAVVPNIGAQTINQTITDPNTGETLVFPEEASTTFVPYILDDSNIAYKKQISEPFTDGTYWIKLETFVTGSIVKKKANIPADIVLVLDVSNSMNWYISGNRPGNPASSTDKTRIDALITAVSSFIDLIDINDQYETYVGEGSSENVYRTDAQGNHVRLGNTISIVTFNGSATTRNTLVELTNKSSLTTTVNNLDNYLGSGTRSDLGLTNAYNILSGLDDTHKLRTVVFFTDGQPTGSSNSSSYSWTSTQYSHFTYANPTISKANDIKKLADDSKGIKANVYSVSVIVDPDEYTQVYLGKTSSNYLGSTSMGTLDGWDSSDIWSNGNGTPNTNGTNYSLSATSVDELVSAFETIAQDSGGSSANIGDSAVETIDIISTSFMLPAGATKDNIKVFTAKCTGVDSNNYLKFGTEVLVPNGAGTYDDAIDVSLSKTTGSSKNDEIGVTGFDFGENWCGPVKDENEQIIDYHGYKIIILIPIQMDTDALGGVDAVTNASGSGIYINNEPFFVFAESPKVDLPVNIIIRKEGLNVGESAKFTIQRVVKPDDMPAQPSSDYYESLSWVDVSSVFVTRKATTDKSGTNAPFTKVVGLPSSDEDGNEFIYRVKEDDWSWSYTSSASTATTSDQLPANPFIFTNTKKDNIDILVRHAESKTTNVFKTGVNSGTYDDSKTNVRP